jgi:rhodanese-related sulfurtransferase
VAYLSRGIIQKESIAFMKALKSLLAIVLAASSAAAFAQEAASAPAAAASARAPQPWVYKTPNLTRNQVDTLLGNPKKLLVIDVRRPDELTKYGSLPVYLNIQIKDLPEALDYIPKDRVILTVSNRAHRAGAAGDLLTSKGFKVAGATGSEDYREAGGTIVKVSPPAPAPAASK